jgi:hypothetical protein
LWPISQNIEDMLTMCNAHLLLQQRELHSFFSCCDGKSCGMRFFGGMMTVEHEGICKIAAPGT